MPYTFSGATATGAAQQVPVYATADDLVACGVSPEAIKRMGPDVIAAILAQASRTADGFLAQRYSLPLLSCGDDLTMLVCQIAAYRIMCRRGWNPADPNNAGLVFLYNEALRTLKSVAVGDLALSVVDTSPEPTYEPDLTSHRPRGY